MSQPTGKISESHQSRAKMSSTASKDENSFAVQGDKSWRQVMTSRTVEHECKFVLPYLDALPPTFVFFDVGCGPGSVPMSVARRYPHATILGVDIDEASITVSRCSLSMSWPRRLCLPPGGQRGGAAAENHQCSLHHRQRLDLQAVAGQPGFEALRGQCDMVHEHVVTSPRSLPARVSVLADHRFRKTMVHVSKPLAMLQQMKKAAREGGFIACRDHDIEMKQFYPSNPGLELWTKTSPDLVKARGCDPQMGRKIVHYAIRAGFKREEIHAVSGDFSFSDPQRWRLWAQGTIDGLANPATVALFSKSIGNEYPARAVSDGWKTWMAQEDAWFALVTTDIVWQNN